MLIFINDDAAYRAWIVRHRDGFVIDAKRKPTRNHVVLHRANCPLVKPHKRARLTTHGHIKACSLDRHELATWTEEETGGGVRECPDCLGEHPAGSGEQHVSERALTRLGRDVLSYVLDLAVMFLDGEDEHFHPTVRVVAEYLDKTPAQILRAIERLAIDGYLTCEPLLSEHSALYPTAQALALVPAFGALPEAELAVELARLHGG